MSPFILMSFLVALSTAQDRGVQIKATTSSGQSIDLYNESHALVVGISEYTAGWPSLSNALKDAYEVQSLLEKKGFKVTLLKNPSSAQLKAGIETFIATAGLDQNNRLLFYFAGHGHTEKKAYGSSVGYIVPADAPDPTKDRRGFLLKAISMERFNTYARDIDAKHVLYLFDSCFSGSIFALSRAAPEAITYKTNQHVRQFITAGSEDEQVPDVSIFKSQFIAALKGEADSNNDGYVTGTELGMFLQDKVMNYSRNAQHPQFGKIRDPQLDKGDFVFVTGAKGSTTEKPPTTGRLDLTAYETERDQAASASQWNEWLGNMLADFDIIQEMDRDVNLSAGSKVKLWSDFLNQYPDQNPHSEDDDLMRKRAEDRKAFWTNPSNVPESNATVKMVEISKDQFSEVYPAMWFSPSDGTVSPILTRSEEPPEPKYEIWVEPGDPEFSFLDILPESGRGIAVVGFGDFVFDSGDIPPDIEFQEGIEKQIDPVFFQERPVYLIIGTHGKCLIQIHRYDNREQIITFKWRPFNQ